MGYHHPRHQPSLGRERKGRRQKEVDKGTEEVKGEGREEGRREGGREGAMIKEKRNENVDVSGCTDAKLHHIAVPATGWALS